MQHMSFRNRNVATKIIYHDNPGQANTSMYIIRGLRDFEVYIYPLRNQSIVSYTFKKINCKVTETELPRTRDNCIRFAQNGMLEESLKIVYMYDASLQGPMIHSILLDLPIWPLPK